MFTIIKEDKNSSARTGVIETAHGIVQTPAYVIVGTHATVRCLPPDALLATKTQIVIANTYHLWRTLGEKKLDSFEGLHTRMGWNGAIMTDSGGFQVFSLGFSREHGVGKIASIFPDEEKGKDRKIQENLVRITNDGAYFNEGGVEYFLDAKTSVAIQEKLGADIILAFDECTSPLHDHAYTAEALKRTHRWAKICLDQKTKKNQKLYGIVQGGAFEDLRKESSVFIGALPFHGFAIGGSLGKSREEMARVLEWTIPYLPKEKPRHLLGIGKIEDIFSGVERGIDTFDCVIPTREARHGAIWTHDGRVDVKKNKNALSAPLESGCTCSACATSITRKELTALFKSKDQKAGELATIHNVFFFNALMQELRDAINEGKFHEFKEKMLEKIRKE